MSCGLTMSNIVSPQVINKSAITMDAKRKTIFTVLMVLVFLLPFLSMQNFSLSTDELTHIPSGYSYWKTGEIKLNPQHPPFVKLWATLPLLFLNPSFDKNDPLIAGAKPDEWQFGRKFLFLSGNDADKIIFWSRTMAILLSVVLALYIFKWTAALFGADAGLFALFLYAFVPTIIAHAQLVTTDVGVAAFATAFLYYLRQLLKTNARKFIWPSGLFLGLALGAKFSAVILLPIYPVLILANIFWNHPKMSGKWTQFFKYSVFIFAIAAAVIYALYFFPSDSGFYKKGLDSVYRDGRAAYQFYLNGDFRSGGWWYYFPEAFVVKNPIPLLAAFFLGLLFRRKIKTDKIDALFLFLPLIAFFLATMIFARDIGVRYIILVYPFLLINSGRIWAIFARSCGLTMSNIVSPQVIEFFGKRFVRAGTISMIILSVWYVVSAVRIFPDYLSYFNELTGGSSNGWKYLDDSNIDWGQDLKRLKKFIVQNPDALVVYPWPPGNEALKYYGIAPEKNLFFIKKNWWAEPKGLYAISSYFLIRAQRIAAAKNDPAMDWLKLYQPSSRIGQSFFVYDFRSN